MEDTLLAGCCRLADLADPEVRRPLLERLRKAGLPELELGVLLSRGDAADLERWLPAVLAEDVPDALRAAVELVRGEGSDRSAVVARLFAKG